MKSPSSKKLFSQIKTVFWITVVWTIFSLYKYSIGYSTIVGIGSLPEIAFDINSLDTSIYLRASLFTGLIAGIIGGGGIVFLWEKWLRSKPYGQAIGSIFLSFLAVYLVVSMLTGLFFQIDSLDSTILHADVWKAAVLDIFADLSIVDIISWLVLVVFTMIVLLVNDKYGPGGFRKFLMGRYFTAQREERVFMFLDLRSSTTIAEKIGEEKYFNFLKDVFETATPGILRYKGEIYQYVGDEIVISWELNSGIRSANCIKCYFEVQALLNRKKDFFLDKYGEEPVFKAGLHYGHVMAGEIGVVKREIAFSGDVLNTTARIQSKCNELGVDILASKFLIDKLNLQPDTFHPREIGEMELRGKKELVTLFTL